jgi:hyperosmotically inducible protein
MMLNFNFRTYLLSGLLMAGATFSLAQSSGDQSPTSPDNTGMNRADRNGDQRTADQQKDRSDRDLTQQIRRSITADKSLSTDAHNVKVITRGGQVTLKGPVQSESEKRTIEAKAAEVAGEDKVTSELAIKPKN